MTSSTAQQTATSPDGCGKPQCCMAAVRSSHGRLRDTLTVRAESLLDSLAADDAHADRRVLVEVVRQRVLPAMAAERSLARASGAPLDQLLRFLPGDDGILTALVDEVAGPSGDPLTTAASVGALVLLCDARWRATDEVLLPALARCGVDLEPLTRTAQATAR